MLGSFPCPRLRPDVAKAPIALQCGQSFLGGWSFALVDHGELEVLGLREE